MIKSSRESPQALLKNIAVNIRNCRARLGLSQEELAHLCGYHRTYIGAIERAERNITIETLCAVAGALDIKAAALLVTPNE